MEINASKTALATHPTRSMPLLTELSRARGMLRL